MSQPTEVTIGAEAILPLPFSNGCGESPFWSVSEQAYFWVDIPAGRIHRWRPEDGAVNTWQMPQQIGCIALRQTGGLIAACESDIFGVLLRDDQAAAAPTSLCQVEHPAANMRFNDGHCDRAGRLWVTSFIASGDKRAIGALFCYTAEGLSPAMLDGFMTPNGTAFSPDNRTLYIADSHVSVRKVWAVDFDLDDGVLGERRLFVDMAGYAGRPDGAAIDTDGCYWVAGMDAGCILRFTPDGELDRIVHIPMKHPTMCAFGGKDMKTMLITSLNRGASTATSDPFAGRVVVIEPGAQGIAEVPFAE